MSTFQNIRDNLIALIISLALYFGALVVVKALPLWVLWNWLVPDIVGLKPINLLQALGFNLLAAIALRGENPLISLMLVCARFCESGRGKV